MRARSQRLGGMASTRWISAACPGSRSAAKRKKEWTAARRALRLRMLFPALAFEMVEEGADECGVEVGQIQLGGRFAEPGLRGSEQQPEGVPVGRDGVRAGAALVEQPAGEERFEGGGQ